MTSSALRASLLATAGGLSVFVFAAAALAQDAAPANPAPAAPAAAAPAADAVPAAPTQDIVVTGSRIARKDYTANSPIVTVGDQLLKQASTSAIEANLNKLPQFTPTVRTPQAEGGDIQPSATNTPGASNISLRGIGSNRNLVLLDGRRATPSDATEVVDINTIPSVAIERVEIISGGASATYGADAVGGVVNFILKKNFQGLQLDAQDSISQRGDGNEYTISGIMGTNFSDNRGNITLAMSTNKREGSYQNNRPWYNKLWANPNIPGTGFFPPFGGVYTGFANLPSAAALNANIKGATFTASPAGTTIYSTASGTAFSGFDTPGVPGVSGFTGIDNFNYKKTNAGSLAVNDTFPYLIYPLTRYNAYARGEYEINDWVSVYGQAIFSKVHTATVQEASPIVTGWAVNIDPTINRAVIPTSILNILDSRPDPTAPFQLSGMLPGQRASTSDVYNYNLVSGIKGKIPGTSWTFDGYVSRGESQTTVTQTGFASLQRLTAIITLPNFGAGFNSSDPSTYSAYTSALYGNAGAPNNGFGASTATCTSGINLFNVASISQDCLNAIKANIQTKSTMQQTVWEGDVQGTLFRAPAGDVKLAIGGSYRSNKYKFENDTLTTQGESFIEQAVGLYPSGTSQGQINTSEVYGEALVPVLNDLPFVKELDLEIGGRMSHYNTTGTSWTYKIMGDYQVNNWLRFRGGFNRAERTPNIAELYLAAQQTFASATGGDVCSTNNQLAYSANPKTNPNYAKVLGLCGQLMEKSGNAAADSSYYGVDYRTLVSATPAAISTLVTQPQSSSASFVFPTLVGNPNLSPETAKTITVGTVISSPFENPLWRRLRLSVDYYKIKVDHAIGAQSPDILQRQCFDPAFNPNYDVNSPYCAGVARNATGALGNLQETYLNNGRFETSGLDVQFDWNFQAGPGNVSLNSVFNYLFTAKAAELPTDPMVEYAGTLGPSIDGLDGNSYRWKLFTTLGYTYHGLYLGLQWQHLPSIKAEGSATIPGFTTLGVPGSYDLFNLQGNLAVTHDVSIRFGIDNLFDKAPPLEGVNPGATLPSLPGGTYDAVNYNTFGRSFYLGATFKF